MGLEMEISVLAAGALLLWISQMLFVLVTILTLHQLSTAAAHLYNPVCVRSIDSTQNQIIPKKDRLLHLIFTSKGF